MISVSVISLLTLSHSLLIGSFRNGIAKRRPDQARQVSPQTLRRRQKKKSTIPAILHDIANSPMQNVRCRKSDPFSHPYLFRPRQGFKHSDQDAGLNWQTGTRNKRHRGRGRICFVAPFLQVQIRAHTHMHQYQFHTCAHARRHLLADEASSSLQRTIHCARPPSRLLHSPCLSICEQRLGAVARGFIYHQEQKRHVCYTPKANSFRYL